MKLNTVVKYIVKKILVPLAITVIGGVLVFYITTNTPKNPPGEHQKGQDITINFTINGDVQVND